MGRLAGLPRAAGRGPGRGGARPRPSGAAGARGHRLPGRDLPGRGGSDARRRRLGRRGARPGAGRGRGARGRGHQRGSGLPDHHRVAAAAARGPDARRPGAAQGRLGRVLEVAPSAHRAGARRRLVRAIARRRVVLVVGLLGRLRQRSERACQASRGRRDLQNTA
ncbi:hypothetical protein SBRY_50808 [Actinacidiphila bryophytorum]|uniref:Uncharacterized protein n=1 Tax=Actinacidiphila bryophytorum TaxID=1436133 RepID=A0A9W4H5J7_9ACTN|nr:hypothetical protein SBRY_50808 [Actinacidiphila bryophytorum]